MVRRPGRRLRRRRCSRYQRGEAGFSSAPAGGGGGLGRLALVLLADEVGELVVDLRLDALPASTAWRRREPHRARRWSPPPARARLELGELGLEVVLGIASSSTERGSSIGRRQVAAPGSPRR
jgi:hypothetical protein